MTEIGFRKNAAPAWEWLVALATLRLLLHTLTNGQYGFHRDELATLADARHLDWGYPAYPPLTPFVARIALELWGPSQVAVRFFTALAQCVGMVVTGLMAYELGGMRSAQIAASLAAAASGVSLSAGHLFQYVSFDETHSSLHHFAKRYAVADRIQTSFAEKVVRQIDGGLHIVSLRQY